MIRRLRCLFGNHRTSFPITDTMKRTYIVCTDCGIELAYDWDRMERGGPLGETEQRMPGIEARELL